MAVGGMYPHVAHGELLAILYPACTRFTMNHAVKEYAFMARILNPDLESVSMLKRPGKPMKR